MRLNLETVLAAAAASRGEATITLLWDEPPTNQSVFRCQILSHLSDNNMQHCFLQHSIFLLQCNESDGVKIAFVSLNRHNVRVINLWKMFAHEIYIVSQFGCYFNKHWKNRGALKQSNSRKHWPV